MRGIKKPKKALHIYSILTIIQISSLTNLRISITFANPVFAIPTDSSDRKLR
jgi:hypothetical protein